MTELLKGQVGPVPLSNGAENAVRLGRSSEVNTADAHGRYQEAVTQGSVFVAAMSAAAAFGATLGATTTTALINPVGSGKNYQLLGVFLLLTTQPALGTAVALAGSTTLVPTVSASAGFNIRNMLRTGAAGSTSAIAAAATASVLTGTPEVILPLMVATVATAAPPAAWIDLGGLVILVPGMAVGINCSAATSGLASFVWEEVPV